MNALTPIAETAERARKVHVPRAPSGWTDECVALLKELWASGATASEIAAELGGRFSRNAIIGKINRLGLFRLGRMQPTRRPVSSPANFDRAEFAQLAPTMSLGELARHFQRTEWTIRLWARNSGISIAVRRPRGAATSARTGLPALHVKPPRTALGAEQTAPNSRLLTLLEMRNGHCRWPIGDPREASFRYCAADRESEDRPYCPFHAALSLVRHDESAA